MAKFNFFCRRCGINFKAKGSTLQKARDCLTLRLGGRKVGEDQGIICGKCVKIECEENTGYGTCVEPSEFSMLEHHGMLSDE